ncbi:MAG: DUF1585 domain-containing protein, partial [Lentisphaeraceae bacterium]|nr:DUF1585 domain-containing protein [Lentisphaeraceae bacterium]
GAKTLRELLAKHSSLQSCHGCHAKIDPLGFALEEFNPIGAHRDFYRTFDKKSPKVKGTRYHKGAKVDATGVMTDGYAFKGFNEFRDNLSSQESLLTKAFVTKLLTFSTGRNMGFSDEPEIKDIVSKVAKKGYRVRDLFYYVINSKIFLSK